jgi:hypothetical protein
LKADPQPRDEACYGVAGGALVVTGGVDDGSAARTTFSPSLRAPRGNPFAAWGPMDCRAALAMTANNFRSRTTFVVTLKMSAQEFLSDFGSVQESSC